MQIKVCTWSDKITPESREHGNFSSLGDDYNENTFDDLTEAIEYALSNINGVDNEIELNTWKLSPKGDLILYSADTMVTDYTTGEEEMLTASIELI